HTIITAAKTVSRASPAFSAGAATMTETISATSITVTATAKTSVPNGSPVRCATTSAWYTAANGGDQEPSCRRGNKAASADKGCHQQRHPCQYRPCPCPPGYPR